jgi:ABC-type Fe3+ transport system substrate-binding protein
LKIPSEQQSPTIKVIGVYSLTADADACRRFIIAEVNKQASAVFTEDEKAALRRIGREGLLEPYTVEQKEEIAGDLYDHLADSTMFEVLVSNPHSDFDVRAFIQPIPDQPEALWQVAWNEKFLAVDGEAPAEVDPGTKVPDAQEFRVAFIIHGWEPELPPLRYGDRELSLLPMHPLPERLWRLAPYVPPN